MTGCDIVLHLAAVTGGIHFARLHPASQFYDSTLIDLNIAEAARLEGVEKLIAIGNLFAYSPEIPSPLRERDLFHGQPAESHRGVGCFKRNLASIADLYHREYGLPMAVVYSANAYGPGDSTDRAHCHVVPATIMKCLIDSTLVVWGDGLPTRDFLYASDIAEGLVLAAERLRGSEYVNIGSGQEVSVKELVELIARLTAFKGVIEFDKSKTAAGDSRRYAAIDVAQKTLGFRPTVSLEAGMKKTVAWYTNVLSTESLHTAGP
jgi:GDP-L-fucose synthase